MTRPTWDEYFMSMVDIVKLRSTCQRRQVGAVLTRGNIIISTGYNGSPRGIKHCVFEKDLDKTDYILGPFSSLRSHFCIREQQSIPSGQRVEMCWAVHGEENCIIQAARNGTSTIDSVLYCTTKPCITCLKTLINAGVKEIIYKEDYSDPLADQLMSECNIQFRKVY